MKKRSKNLLCMCGCREKIDLLTKAGKPRKYIIHHAGKNPTLETRKKISLGITGRTPTLETRKKLSLAKLGIKHTDEHKKKISIANSGKKLSDETRYKMSLAKIGKNIGRKHSDETKEKIRKKRLSNVFPSKDSIPEKMMQLALDLNGIKYEKHKPIIGQPDIFIAPNLCIFVDGDFWHANPSKYTNPNKILIDKKTVGQVWANDRKINDLLTKEGYFVIRLWESSIRANRDQCAKNIINLIKQTQVCIK